MTEEGEVKRMSHPNPRNVCDGCGQTLDRRRRGHVLLGPIVHEEIWRRLAKPTEALCWQCMLQRARVRLRRMLALADLRPCPWNLFHRPYSWLDLFVEMEGGMPPANLAAWRAAWCVIGEPGEFEPSRWSARKDERAGAELNRLLRRKA
jgi:hypothetical protein